MHIKFVNKILKINAENTENCLFRQLYCNLVEGMLQMQRNCSFLFIFGVKNKKPMKE